MTDKEISLEIKNRKKEIEDIFEKLKEMQTNLYSFMWESLKDDTAKAKYIENCFLSWTNFDIPNITERLKESMLDCLSFASEETLKENGYIEYISTAYREDYPADSWCKAEAEAAEETPVISWCKEEGLKNLAEFDIVKVCPDCGKYVVREVPYCMCGHKFFDSKADKKAKRKTRQKQKQK